jgi:hypothetical protein
MKTSNTKILAVSTLTLALLGGCASQPEVVAEPEPEKAKATEYTQQLLGLVPDWYINPPKTTNMGLYAVATATNDDLQFAVNQATLLSEQQLVKRMASEVSSVEANSTQSVNNGNNSTIATQDIEAKVSGYNLFGHEVVKREILPDPKTGAFRVFVLTYLSPKSQADVLQHNFKKDETLLENKALKDYIKELEDMNAKAQADNAVIKQSVNTQNLVTEAG